MSTGPETFGELLRSLRLRARLSEQELGRRVGHTEKQIVALEESARRPDPIAVASLFVPALRLSDVRQVARLVQLATLERAGGPAGQGPAGAPQPARAEHPLPPLPAALPSPPPYLVQRAEVADLLGERLAADRCVVLCGLAGMGKTALAAAHARARAPWQGVVWLTLSDGADLSVPGLVARLARFARDLGDPRAGRLLDTAEPALPPEEEQRLLAEVLRPVAPLLCLDNAQLLADQPGVLRLLELLAGTGAATVLLVSREELPMPGTSVLRLGGLRAEEARMLVDRMAPGLDGGLTRTLVERTGGSPMLLRLALGQLGAAGEGADLTRLVARLESRPEVDAYLMDTTLARLGDGARLLAGLLAVFRRPVDLLDEALADLLPAEDSPDDLLAAVRELGRRQLVDDPARAALHPLVHDHVYAHLVGDLARRRRLHLVAARWSEPDDPLEAAWHHLRAARPEDAADVLTQRVRLLLGRGQAAAAADLALDILRADLPAELARGVRVARGDLLAGTDRAIEAEDAYREALAGDMPPALAAQITWRLSERLLHRGQVFEARDLCRQAAATLSEGDTVISAELGAIECQAHMMLGDHEDAVAVGERALALATAATTVAPALAAEVEARVRSTLGVVHRIRREREPAESHLRQAAAAGRRAGLSRLAVRATYNIGAIQAEYGELDEAVATFESILPEIRATDDSHNLGRALQGHGMTRYMRGEAAAAVALLEEAREVNTRLGDVQAVAASENGLALALFAAGRTAAARRIVERMLADTSRTGERIARANYLDTLGTIALVEGDPAAVRLLTEARDVAVEIKGAPYVVAVCELHLALALAAAGQLPGARAILEHVPREEMGDLALELAFAEGVLALLGGDREAAAAAAARMAEGASGRGYGRYALAAGRLGAALDAPTRTSAQRRALAGLLFTDTSTETVATP